jgi:DNA-binding GntR family transcriptional regulator
VTKVLELMKNGSIQPRERPIEWDIAERFFVSRAPLRDAMRREGKPDDGRF